MAGCDAEVAAADLVNEKVRAAQNVSKWNAWHFRRRTYQVRILASAIK
jgi:hypothetical protein